MRRMLLSLFVLVVVAGAGSGCKIPGRMICETGEFSRDVQRVFFGIDYPGNNPETFRQRFYGLPVPGSHQSVCD